MRNSVQLAVLGAAVSALFAAAPKSALAADQHWLGSSSNFWTTTTNWFGFTPPGPADNAIFEQTGSFLYTPVRSNVILDASRSINEMYVYGDTPVGTYSFTKTGSAVLTAAGRIQFGGLGSGVATMTFNNFAANANVLVVAGTATGVLTGSSQVTATALTQVQEAAVLNVSGSSLTSGGFLLYNQSQINVQSGGTFTTTSNGESSLNGASKLTVQSGGSFINNNGVAVLGGELVLQSGSTFSLASGRQLSARGSTAKISINRGFGMDTGTTLLANAGGDIVGTSYIDIGNGNTGTLSLDGTGTTLATAGATASDWGNGAGSSFTGTLSNNAAATLQSLRLGTSGGVASLSILSGSTFSAATFEMGGASTVRNVSLTVNGGSFNSIGTTTFNDKAVVNLQGGTLKFTAGATVNAGATISRTGGTLDITGVALNVAGGTFNRNGVGLELSNGSTLRLTAGGQSPGTSYLDVANSNTTGTLTIDGAGSLVTAGGAFASDWGAGTGHSATVSLSNSAQANMGALQIGTSNAAANVSVTGAAVLSTSGTLTIGGGSTPRTVAVNVTGSTLTTAGLTTLGDNAVLTVGNAGVVNFNNGVSVLAGGKLTRTGGTVTVASGKILDVVSGQFNRGSTGMELSNGATLRLTSAGQSPGTSYFDIARVNTTGTLTIDGTGSVLATGGAFASDWGAGAGRSASVAISNFGEAQLGDLQVGTDNAAATVSVGSSGAISTTGTLTAGGNTTARTVAINIAGGTLTTGGLLTLSNQAVLNLGAAAAGGTVNLNGSATLNAGSNLNWSSGTLTVASGKTLSVNGGTLTRTTLGGVQSVSSTLAITGGGTYTTTNYLDITTGTLNVDGTGSNLTVNGSAESDWSNPGTLATVNLTNGGVATYNNGLRMSYFGGTTNVTINTGGRLNLSNLTADFGSIAIGVNNPSSVSPAISVSGSTLMAGSNTTLTLTSGRVAMGSLTMAETARIIPTAATNTGTVAVSALLMSGTSKIDLASGRLEYNYTGTSPLAALRGLIGVGHNGGDWLGDRITSSAAAASPTSNLGLYYGGTSTQINVKLALYGDADGDGGVSINDFNALATSFGVGSGKFWTDGDFDYDGGVSINDFNRLATNFGKTLASPSEGPNFAALVLWDFAVAHNDEAAFIAATGVPEPTGLAVFALGGVATLQRRRR